MYDNCYSGGCKKPVDVVVRVHFLHVVDVVQVQKPCGCCCAGAKSSWGFIVVVQVFMVFCMSWLLLAGIARMLWIWQVFSAC